LRGNQLNSAHCKSNGWRIAAWVFTVNIRAPSGLLIWLLSQTTVATLAIVKTIRASQTSYRDSDVKKQAIAKASFHGMALQCTVMYDSKIIPYPTKYMQHLIAVLCSLAGGDCKVFITSCFRDESLWHV